MSEPGPVSAEQQADSGAAVLTVAAIGVGTVTDLGRRATRLGQSVGGALDQYSARLANALVGNEPDRPLVELMASGAQFRAERSLVLSLVGAVKATVDGALVHPEQPFVVDAGQLLVIHRIVSGLRCYLAVRGGFAAHLVLGSCAPDAFTGVGRMLRPGDVLRQVDEDRPSRVSPGPILARLGVAELLRPDRSVVDVTIGLHAGYFSDVDRIYRGEFTVTDRSNQVGLRLAGEVPQERVGGEVLSMGVPIGAVEVPGSGELLALHRGRGVTAGYPVVAVATTFGLDTLAQAAPGDVLRLRQVELSDAIQRVRQQRHQLAQITRRAGVVLSSLGA